MYTYLQLVSSALSLRPHFQTRHFGSSALISDTVTAGTRTTFRVKVDGNLPPQSREFLSKLCRSNWTSHLRFNNIIQYSFNHIQCMSFMIHPSEEETQGCKHLFHSKTTIFGYLQVDPINLQIWQNNLLWAFKSMKAKWPAIFLASTSLEVQRLPQPQVISSDLKCLLQQF